MNWNFVRFYLLLACSCVSLDAVNAPAWWQIRGAAAVQPFGPGHPLFDSAAYDQWMQRNYSVALVGQAKQMAKQAYLEMEDVLPGSSGSVIGGMVSGFSDDPSENYRPLLLGQLKALVKPFYDRFKDADFEPSGIHLYDPELYPYPWDTDTMVSDNYAPVTVGQLKYAFSFSFFNNHTPEFEPDYWNSDSYIKGNNNCYNYACNRLTNTNAQPGRASGYPPLTDFLYPPPGMEWDGQDVYERAEADGLQAGLIDVEEDEWTNVALRFGPEKTVYIHHSDIYFVHPADYHWYRQDRNSYWSHKPGSGTARNYDSNGDLILDPSGDIGVSTDWLIAYCDGEPFYTEFVGFMHVNASAMEGQGTAEIE